MMIDMEEIRLALRDRQIAMSSARRAFDENWDRVKIDDAHAAERAAIRCSEMAAYYAVMAEREAHAHDMAALKLWMEARQFENVISVKPVLIQTGLGPSEPSGGDASNA